MNKKILFVVPSWNQAGTEIVNVAIANKLSEQNNVAICTLASPVNQNLQTSSPLYGKSDFNLKIYSMVNSLLGLLHLDFLANIWMGWQAKYISEVCKRESSETVILSGLGISLIPLIKRKNPKLKIIAWCHFSAEVYLNTKPFKYTSRLWERGFSMADVAVSLTPTDKDELLKINKNTIVINNPLVIQNTQVSELSEKYISWTGRIKNPQKGIDYLAEVASFLPEGWKISIAGDGDLDQFSKYLDKHKSRDKVVLRGMLSGEELQKHYLNSSIYLMTSRHEGLALVLVEAMSFGLPIVAFDQSGSRYALDEGNYGILVENGNVKEMKNRILELIQDDDRRQYYQKKSLERLQEFKIENVCQDWEKII